MRDRTPSHHPRHLRRTALFLRLVAVMTIVPAAHADTVFPPTIELLSLLSDNGGDGSEGFVLPEITGFVINGTGLEVRDYTTAISGLADINGDHISDLSLATSRSGVFVVFGRAAADVSLSTSVTGLTPVLRAVCADPSTGQTVQLPQPITEVDCKVAGFTPIEGNAVRINVRGLAGGTTLAGDVERLSDASVLCRNLTTGAGSTSTVDSSGARDCTAGGMELRPGDRVNVLIRGVAR